MKSVEAFECQHCKALYRSLSEMDSCGSACFEAKQEEQAQEDLKAIRTELQNYVRLNAENVQDIEQMCIDISKKIFPKSPLKSMKLSVKYVEHARNTHSCPLNGVENWRKKYDKPTGYPALFGRISFEVDYLTMSRSHRSPFNKTGIHGINTGSGGLRGNTYSYDVTLWLDDFPKIKQNVEDAQRNQEDFCKLFSEKSRIKSEVIESDQFVKELDMDIQTLQDRIKELQVQLTNISKLKDERIDVLTRPLQKDVDKMWKITENDFGIPRPYSTL